MTHRTLILPLMLAACGSAQSQPAPAALPVPRWDAARCAKGDAPDATPERNRVLERQSPEALLAAYGKPSNDERFRVGEPGGVFYGALGKMPPGRTHPDAGRSARVLTWTKSGCELNVFFVQRAGGWAVVQAFEAAAGADY